MAIRAKKNKNEVKEAVPLASYGVLLAPIVTEKTAQIAGSKNRAVFKVHPNASKTDIKNAIESVFKVKVDSVNTVNVMGKVKRTTGMQGRRVKVKKAYVTLAEGHKIELVEGI